MAAPASQAARSSSGRAYERDSLEFGRVVDQDGIAGATAAEPPRKAATE